MSNRFCQAVVVTATALFLTGEAGFARSPMTNSHTKAGQVDVLYLSKVANGPELHPGTYKVELGEQGSSTHVAFYKDGKLAAQAPAKLIDEGKKSHQTDVHYDTAGNEHVITQIDLRGWNEAVMFNSSHSPKAGS